MAKNRNKTKVNIPMCIAGVLLCLTMITTYLVSGLYARYTTVGIGSDAARVIRFGDITITETGSTGNSVIIPGVDIDKGVTVSFTGSEAATYLFVEVSAGKWNYADRAFEIGGYLRWEVADGWTYLADRVFYRELAPNERVSDMPVVKNDTITVSNTVTASSIDELANILSFRASVVQSNGFDSPAAAWSSLENRGGAAG